MSRITGQVTFTDPVQFPGGVLTKFDRTQLSQESGVAYPVDLTTLRVWNALHTNLPGTAADDDLALIGGTLGTASPTIRTLDSGTLSTTAYARFLFRMPAEYEAAGTVVLRMSAGMNSESSGTTADGSATLDAQVYRIDRDGGVSSDLCATSATTINATGFADKDFTITSSALAAGDLLDTRIAIAIVDTSTVPPVIGQIGAIEFLLDIRG